MFRNPDRLVRGLVRSKFILTTKQGATWEGVLFDADDISFELADVTAIGSDGSRTPADGRVLITRADVAYIQRP